MTAYTKKQKRARDRIALRKQREERRVSDTTPSPDRVINKQPLDLSPPPKPKIIQRGEHFLKKFWESNSD